MAWIHRIQHFICTMDATVVGKAEPALEDGAWMEQILVHFVLVQRLLDGKRQCVANRGALLNHLLAQKRKLLSQVSKLRRQHGTVFHVLLVIVDCCIPRLSKARTA